MVVVCVCVGGVRKGRWEKLVREEVVVVAAVFSLYVLQSCSSLLSYLLFDTELEHHGVDGDGGATSESSGEQGSLIVVAFGSSGSRRSISGDEFDHRFLFVFFHLRSRLGPLTLGPFHF